MKKLIFSMMLLCGFTSVNAAPAWTGWQDIGVVYTYASPDTMYVWLDGVQCPNTKKYFTISPANTNNAKQLISMILSAKMAKSKVSVFYESGIDATHCYFKGLQIQ